MARDELDGDRFGGRTTDPHERLAALRRPLRRPAEPDPDLPDDLSAWRTWIDESAAPDRPPDPSGPEPPGPAGLRRWLPEALRGARVDPGRRGAVVLALAAVVAALVAVTTVWGGRPQAEPVPALPVVSVSEPSPGSSTSGQPPPSGAAAAPAPLVVSVTGKVTRPGLVTVPDGARVADVLEAAGGPLPGVDIGVLNLARKVVDGEQVAVGVPAAPDAVPAGGAAGGAASASGGGPAAAASGPVDLNSAGAEQLDTLPGVGPVTAQRIIEWRTRNGRFTRVEQLREVEGIGERRFEQLRGLVRV